MANKFFRFLPLELAAGSDAIDAPHMVYGYCSTEVPDGDGQVVTRTAMDAAWPEYIKFGNIRVQHDKKSAAGQVRQWEADEKGYWIAVEVLDDEIWEKLKKGLYKGFSIGGDILRRVGKKILEIVIYEISLVDRPSNPEAVFDLAKAYGGKMPEKLQKSLWDVKTMADIVQSIHNLEESKEYAVQIDSADASANPQVVEALTKLTAAASNLLQMLTAFEVEAIQGEETAEALAQAIGNIEGGSMLDRSKIAALAASLKETEALVGVAKESLEKAAKPKEGEGEGEGAHTVADCMKAAAAHISKMAGMEDGEQEKAAEEHAGSLHKIHKAMGKMYGPEKPEPADKAAPAAAIETPAAAAAAPAPVPAAPAANAQVEELAKAVGALSETVKGLSEMAAPGPDLMIVDKDGNKEPLSKSLEIRKDDDVQTIIRKNRMIQQLQKVGIKV